MKTRAEKTTWPLAAFDAADGGGVCQRTIERTGFAHRKASAKLTSERERPWFPRAWTDWAGEGAQIIENRPIRIKPLEDVEPVPPSRDGFVL